MDLAVGVGKGRKSNCLQSNLTDLHSHFFLIPRQNTNECQSEVFLRKMLMLLVIMAMV